MQIDALREDLQKQIETLREQIGQGFAKTFEDYKQMTGRLRGLVDAYEMTLPRPKEETHE